MLFAGLTPLAVVEAKRRNTDVAGKIPQSKRYSIGYQITDEQTSAGGPWGECQVPFLFSANGRDYLKQLRTKSGIWFLDARRSTNHPRPLVGWYSPRDLKQLLKRFNQPFPFLYRVSDGLLDIDVFPGFCGCYCVQRVPVIRSRYSDSIDIVPAQ